MSNYATPLPLVPRPGTPASSGVLGDDAEARLEALNATVSDIKARDNLDRAENNTNNTDQDLLVLCIIRIIIVLFIYYV